MPSSRSFSRFAVGVVGCLIAVGSASAQRTAPDQHVIRVWGFDGLSAQLLRWEADYGAAHPEIRFENQMHGAAAVMAGLYNGVADIALMGREIWPVETMAYQWVFQQQPFGVVVATTGLHAPGQLFTPVVIVNAKNPLATISLSQLDAIYGSEHRAAPANIRTWGELGVGGEWADKPIHPYGYSTEDALGVYFRHDVLHADFKPNRESHLLSDRDHGTESAAERIARAVAADPYAIGYTEVPRGGSTKVLTLGSAMGIEPTVDHLASHEYSLTRSLWIYFRRVPGQVVDPKVDGFVRFLLSPHGQTLMMPSDKLLPLPSALIDKQIEKLDKPMPKAAVAEEN